MSRNLNKVQFIGNLTRDPELKTMANGVSVCTFAMATNRDWVTESGEKKQDTEYHRIVAWHKLGELCHQLLTKGRKIYVEGRVQHRDIENENGKKTLTEFVIDDMIILDSNKSKGGEL